MKNFAAIGFALILAAVAVDARPPDPIATPAPTLEAAEAPVIVSHTFIIDAAADLGDTQAAFVVATPEAGFRAELPRAAPVNGSAWRSFDRMPNIHLAATESGYNLTSGRLRLIT